VKKKRVAEREGMLDQNEGLAKRKGNLYQHTILKMKTSRGQGEDKKTF
jgi:hypothetical protein